MSQGTPFKRFWRFVQQLHTHPFSMMREGKSLDLLWTSSEVKLTRRHCRPFHSPRRWEHWPISWSSTSTRWRIWLTCQHHGPFFYLISSLKRRSTFAITSTTSSPSASQREIRGWSYHFQVSSWLLLQRQGWRFLVVFPWCQGIIQSVLKQ